MTELERYLYAQLQVIARSECVPGLGDACPACLAYAAVKWADAVRPPPPAPRGFWGPGHD